MKNAAKKSIEKFTANHKRALAEGLQIKGSVNGPYLYCKETDRPVKREWFDSQYRTASRDLTFTFAQAHEANTNYSLWTAQASYDSTRTDLYQTITASLQALDDAAERQIISAGELHWLTLQVPNESD